MISQIRFLLLVLLVLMSFSGLAQNSLLKGQVLDETTQQAVAFATLGVKDQAIGSVADTNGQFSFTVPDAAAAAAGQVLVSCLGYQRLPFPLRPLSRGHK
jgi:hypothetical protein